VTADNVDLRLLAELVRDPRLSVSELSERIGVARNTAQSRLDRLQRSGVLGANDRGVDLAGLGFVVSAVVGVSVRHAEIEDTIAALTKNPQVLLVEEVAGSTVDLHVRVACRSTEDLQQVVHDLLSAPGVVSTATQVVLKTRVPFRVAALLEHLSSSPTPEP
jgi:DNA-binding Lrp family transcriptional regulator